MDIQWQEGGGNKYPPGWTPARMDDRYNPARLFLPYLNNRSHAGLIPTLPLLKVLYSHQHCGCADMEICQKPTVQKTPAAYYMTAQTNLRPKRAGTSKQES